MNFKTLGTVLLAGVAAVGLTMSAAEASNGGSKLRLRCKAVAADIGKMQSRYEQRTKVGKSKDRKRFRVYFEADENSTLTAGAQLDVWVSTATGTDPFVMVGSMILKDGEDEDHEIEGKLRFDSKPHSTSHPWQPFPANWPTDVAAGTDIELRLGAEVQVGCELN